jgi:hypothetical protein
VGGDRKTESTCRGIRIGGPRATGAPAMTSIKQAPLPDLCPHCPEITAFGKSPPGSTIWFTSVHSWLLVLCPSFLLRCGLLFGYYMDYLSVPIKLPWINPENNVTFRRKWKVPDPELDR